MMRMVSGDDVETRVKHGVGFLALDFYQASCRPCKVLAPRLETWAAQRARTFPVYRIDIDQDMPVAHRFNVQTIPTVLILRDGQEVQRLDGLVSGDDLQSAVERAGIAAGV